MSGDNLRRALRAFDDAALSTLASKGLLRRAGRDLQAGKVKLVEERDDRATIEADGEKVDIGTDGPAAARCSCRAQGLCRHRIAAVLLLRTADEPEIQQAKEEPDLAAEQPAPVPSSVANGDPLAEILALEADEIARWAGKATLRAATEMCDAAKAPAIDIEGASLVVRLDPQAAEVRFLAGQGLAGMISKAPRAKRKALHAAAILLVRRRDLPDDQTAHEPSSERAPIAAAAPADPGFLAAVTDCLADCVRTGFNQAPLALEERLFALSVSSRADSLPRLSALLRTLAARVRAKRERDFSLDPDAYLALVAETYALSRALLSGSKAPLDPEYVQALRGQIRQDYRPAGRLTLFGMGARAWRTAAGASGITGYFYAPEQGHWYSAGRARATAYDTTFSPQLTYERETLWGAGPLSALCRSKFELESAMAAPDGRLSLGTATSGRTLPWPAEEADLAAWSLAFGDWIDLEAHLHRSFASGLGQRSQGLVPVLLIPKSVAMPYFDEIAQETVWPLRDTNSAWLAVTLGHEESVDNSAAADFERILRSESPKAVAVLARPAQKRFDLHPYAFFLPDTAGGWHNIGLDPIANAGVEGTVSLLRRFGRDAASVMGIGQGRFSRSMAVSATDRALTEAGDALLGIAELGGAHGTGSAEQIEALAGRFQSYGLDPLAQALGRLDGSDSGDLPPRLLEAVYLIDRTRALLRSLPYLSPL